MVVGLSKGGQLRVEGITDEFVTLQKTKDVMASLDAVVHGEFDDGFKIRDDNVNKKREDNNNNNSNSTKGTQKQDDKSQKKGANKKEPGSSSNNTKRKTTATTTSTKTKKGRKSK